MGGKNSTQTKNYKNHNLLDPNLSKKIKFKVRNLLSCVEEKVMRILILLIQVNDNHAYGPILKQFLQQGQMYKLLEKVDFISWDVNERLDMLFYDMFELFDEDVSPEEFRGIRHSISGDTFDLFRDLWLRNNEGKVAKWNTVYDWVFDGSNSKCLFEEPLYI